MKTLLVYLKPYRKEAILAPFLKLLEATLELFVPLVMTVMIDRGIAMKDEACIVWQGAILLGLASVGMAVSITAQYFAAKAAIGFTTDVKREAFVHILHMPMGSIESVGPATLITRLTSDMNQVSTGVNLFLRLFLRSPFIVFGAMVMAFTIDVKAALVFAVVIPVLGLLVYVFLKVTIPMYHLVQRKLDTVGRRTRETLSGARVIRAFNRERQEKEEFDRDVGELSDEQIRAGRIAALMNPVTLLIVNIAIVCLIYVGGIRVEIGDLTQGQVVALVSFMSQILVELIKLANLILTINRSLACAGRVRDLLEMPAPEMPACVTEGGAEGKKASVRPKGGTRITGHHLSFRYPEAQGDALTDISFEVRPGETLGIIGGTGAGKSTLLSLIMGHYEASGGELICDGGDRIGYVPQKSVLFAGTIEENLRWDERVTEEEIWEALRVAQADGFVRDKGGLGSPVEQGGRNLSGGQKQRLCIARALLCYPKLFLLDDAFSALDASTEASLRAALPCRFLSGATKVIVSQRAASVRRADRILVLDEGKMVGLGTHDELMNHCDIYREIVRIGGGA